MATRNSLIAVSGVILFIAGASLGLALSGVILWAEIEASYGEE